MADFVTAFAVLAANDLERARAWYAEKLGLQPAMSLPESRTDVYVINGAQLTIYETASAGSARSTALGLVVEDLRAVMDELRSRGVVFEEYDLENGPTTVDGVSGDAAGGMAAWFTDSEGNIVNLVQLPPGFPVPHQAASRRRRGSFARPRCRARPGLVPGAVPGLVPRCAAWA